MHPKILATFFAIFFLSPICAFASQTDAALSIYGAFSSTTSGNGTTQSPANAAGGMIELRHLVHPWLGYEATYSFNRANQSYTYPGINPPCPSGGCGGSTSTQFSSVSANAHEFTGDWVASLKLLNLRPFALAGVGLLLDVPTSGTYTDCSTASNTCVNAPTNTSTKPVFVYGAGLDWGLLPHLGLRFQYRGNVYKAASLANAVRSTNAFMTTAEPMIGAYFRF